MSPTRDIYTLRNAAARQRALLKAGPWRFSPVTRELVLREAERARIMHGDWPDDLAEGVLIIYEEIGELVQAVNDYTHQSRPAAAIALECTHAMATILRHLQKHLPGGSDRAPETILDSIEGLACEKFEPVDPVRNAATIYKRSCSALATRAPVIARIGVAALMRDCEALFLWATSKAEKENRKECPDVRKTA